MEFHEYLNNLKEIQNGILEFISNENYTSQDLKNLTDLFVSKNILDNKHKLKELLVLLSNISNDHKHTRHFFTKFGQIFEFLKDNILHFFTNYEIYDIYRMNKRILLQLNQQKILEIDEIITKNLIKNKSNICYFYPEIKPFLEKNIGKNDLQIIESKMTNYQKSNDFQKLRDDGENHHYICSLIRDDSVIEFISYVNHRNYPLSSQIEVSLFESNFLLNFLNPTLIEYSAFFGSIQIFQYLRMNGVELTPSLWIYAIHGKNPELIHILEENEVIPEDKTYQKCYLECIKCHHNDFANYIKLNYLEYLNKNEKKSLFDSFIDLIKDKIFHIEDDKYFIYYIFALCNFALVDDDDIIGKIAFFSMCQYGHYEMAKLLINNKNIDVNLSMIL